MVKVDLIQEIRPRLDLQFNPYQFEARTPAIAEAYAWGREIHAGQKRLSGEPYFEVHCGWVADFLDRLVQNESWTIAALLHDSTEDRGVTLDEIRARFPGELGERVAFIVDGVTKLSTPHNGRSRELETLRKIAMFRDPGVFLVKLADKSHNIMTLEHMQSLKAARKAEEAIRAYGKLAGILNCYRWRRWLEDMAFPHADPQTFAFVRERIDGDPRMKPEFINTTLQQLGQLMDREGIPGRVEIIVNGYWQAWQKLRRMARLRRASLNSFTMVNDLVSFRMVVENDSEADCYRLLAVVNRYLGAYLDQNRFDDYIASPQNGYRALQVTAWFPDYGAVEVAIATADMEGENQWGIVHALQQGRDISRYHPVVFLTPTGGVRFVPEGSTVLDAIAAIQHEFLLDKISAVKINDTLARLSEKIQPGDVVEVITGSQRIRPSEDWLHFCNPSTARTLRAVLATEALKAAADQGRQKIKTVLSGRGILALEDVAGLRSDKIDNLLERLGASGLEDLYAAAGGGAIRMEDLSRALDELGITKQALQWTTIDLAGTVQANRPGVLAMLASLVSSEGGNILRSINNTTADGSFTLRLVVSGLTAETEPCLRQAFLESNVELNFFELV